MGVTAPPTGSAEERHGRSSVAVIALSIGLATAGALSAWAAPGGSAPATESVPELLAFVVLLVAAGHLTVTFRYGDDTGSHDFFASVLAPLIVFADPFVAVSVAAAAQAVTNAARRNEPLKAAFNVAQTVGAAGVAVALYRALGGGEALDARAMAALAVALIAHAFVEEIAFAGVMAVVHRTRLVAVLRDIAPVSLSAVRIGSWAANAAFGVLFAAAYDTSPLTIALFAGPLLLLYASGRGYATERTDRARLAALQRATHELGRSIDPRESFGAFLAEVRDCFESEAVELVLFEHGQRHRWRMDAGGLTHDVGDESTDLVAALAQRSTARRILPDDADAELAALLRGEGWRDCIAAPLRTDDKVIGILRSCNRGGLEGFDEGELAVLEALGREAAAALERVTLLSTILEERQTLSEIVGSTSDGIVTIESDGTVTTWNPGIESVTGYSAGEMVGCRRIPVLRARDAKGDDVFLERWSDDVPLPAQVQVTTRDDEARWLSCSYARVPGASGRLPSLVIVARDVTRAYELDRLKDEFVATVSHELRTPLVPIKGFVSTLLQHGESLSPERRHEALESILRSAQRLEHLVLNLLEVSRVDSATSIPEPVPVSTTELVEQLLDDLRQSWPERAITGPAAGSNVMALANPLWIEQVLTNLLSNAIKYTPPTTPIEVTIETAAGEVRINVVDHGPGIPEHAVERIFERWERLHLDDTQAGTGLGLYIARRLTEAMNGQLRVSTTPGGGATFSLVLPAIRHLAAVV